MYHILNIILCCKTMRRECLHLNSLHCTNILHITYLAAGGIKISGNKLSLMHFCSYTMYGKKVKKMFYNKNDCYTTKQ